MIVDAQIHEPSVELDWGGAPDSVRRQLLTELQLGYMRAAGVDRALVNPADLEWGLEVVEQHPDRFALVPLIMVGGMHEGLDPAADDIGETIAEYSRNPGVVAFRAIIVMAQDTDLDGQPSSSLVSGVRELREGLFDSTFRACEEQGVPLFVELTGEVAALREVALRFPDLKLILDHMGMPGPPSYVQDSPPMRLMSDLLSLAEHPNIHLKATAVPSLSCEPYPFADIWPNMRRIVDAFGADRIMWGSDISRVHGRIGFNINIGSGLDSSFAGRHSYAESVLAFRETDALSDREKRLMMGETLLDVIGWPKSVAQPSPG